MVPVEQRWSSLRGMSFYPSGLATVAPAACMGPMKSIVFFLDHVSVPAAVGRIRGFIYWLGWGEASSPNTISSPPPHQNIIIN